jgi:hypothetical protein
VRTTRVFDLAARIAAATGTRARIRRRQGGYLIEAPLPGDLDEAANDAVLAALSAADRFGHQFRDSAQEVWAELDDDQELSQ